jgi:hypothetical protein
MKIFLSWSKDRSKKVAEIMGDWLQNLFPHIELFFSPDIEKGTRGLDAIASALQDTNFGVIFLTPENRHNEWIHYEAGALSKLKAESRVWTFLYDLRNVDVTGPLAQVQHTENKRDDIMALVQSINRNYDQPIELARLEKSFTKWFPDLESALSSLPLAELGDEGQSRRPQEDVLDEILETVRSLAQTKDSNRIVTTLMSPQLASSPISFQPSMLQTLRLWIYEPNITPERKELILGSIEGVLVGYPYTIKMADAMDSLMRTLITFEFEVPVERTSVIKRIVNALRASSVMEFKLEPPQ